MHHRSGANGGGSKGAGAEGDALVEGLVRPWQTGTPVPALSGVMLVWGGVSGEMWLADLQAVRITRTGERGVVGVLCVGWGWWVDMGGWGMRCLTAASIP